jgi:hypothetical protein
MYIYVTSKNNDNQDIRSIHVGGMEVFSRDQDRLTWHQ